MRKLTSIEFDNYQKRTAQEENQSMGRWIIAGGGMGSNADLKFAEMIQLEPLEFPLIRCRIDTDQREPTTAIDIPISLKPEQVVELKASPRMFGDHILQAVEALGDRLHPNMAENGARTTRSISKCHLAYHRRDVLKKMRLIINDFYDQGCKSVKPILVGSCGGGTNSGLVPAMCQWLSHDSSFRTDLLVGLPPHFILDPIVVVCFPLNYVRSGSPTERQEVCIGANIYAWELEMDTLYRQSKIDQIYQVPYYSTEERTTQALADAIYDVAVHEPFFKSRNVDKLAGHQETGYFGGDGL